MWLFTENGFVSAVAHRDDKTLMMVRARDKKSLERLALIADTKIITTPTGSDYPHRVVVTKEVFKDWVTEAIDNVMYDNFKTQVAKTRGHEYAEPLHDVWAVMLQAEDVKRGGKKSSGKFDAAWEWNWKDK